MKKMEVESFVVNGFTARTTNQQEMDVEKARIPGLWRQFLEVVEVDPSSALKGYGVYSNYQSDWQGAYDITVGTDGDFTARERVSITIPAGTFLCFETTGSMPHAVLELWEQVWKFFQEEGAPQRTYQCDFEEYRSPDSAAIYISIEGGSHE